MDGRMQASASAAATGFKSHLAAIMAEAPGGERCPISGEAIEAGKRIQLPCGHAYDIDYLYMEVRRQKLRPSAAERPRLSLNEIKCPYCRAVLPRLLPPMPGQPTSRGVNSPRRYCFFPNRCAYVYAGGRRKGEACMSPCFIQHCAGHARIVARRSDRLHCHAVLSRGPRAGQECGRGANSTGRCKTHLNTSIVPAQQ